MLLLAALICSAHPHYRLAPLVGAVAVHRNGNAYRASARLRFVIEPPVRAPSSADRGLADHVRGHQIIAARVAASSIGVIQADARTAAAARARLAQAIDRVRSDAQRELQREEQVYDTVTEDGLAQDQGPVYGFPGGANARETCRQ